MSHRYAALPLESIELELLHHTQNEDRRAAKGMPSGYAYRPPAIISVPSHNRKTTLRVVALSPHPSDATADLAAGILSTLAQRGALIEEWLLSRGELGSNSMAPAETIAVRIEEERHSAAMLGIKPSYLSRDGALVTPEDCKEFANPESERYFPDGSLMEHIEELTELLKARFLADPPDCLILPSLYPDHPDHLATTLAALNALDQLRGRLPQPIEVICSDPEFALSAGLPWAVENIPQVYGGRAAINGIERIKPFHFHWAQDQVTGVLSPAPIAHEVHHHHLREAAEVAVPPFMLGLSESQVMQQMQAIAGHETQMVEWDHDGRPVEKTYQRLIPGVSRMMAKLLPKATPGPEYGGACGLYPVNMPGITPEDGMGVVMKQFAVDGRLYQLHAVEAGQEIDITSR